MLDAIKAFFFVRTKGEKKKKLLEWKYKQNTFLFLYRLFTGKSIRATVLFINMTLSWVKKTLQKEIFCVLLFFSSSDSFKTVLLCERKAKSVVSIQRIMSRF